MAAAALVTALAGAAPAAAQERRSVVIAFHPGGGDPRPGFTTPPTVFSRLSDREQLSLGLMGATQGPYSRRQALLDMSAGARVSRSGYTPEALPDLALRGTRFAGWDAVLERARSAPTRIVPGLLAASVPGGAAYYAPPEARSTLDAIVAADTRGRVAHVALTPAPVRALEGRPERLAVVVLPEGRRGDRALERLIRTRDDGQLLLVIFRPPRSRAHQMLPIGAAGLREPPGLLTSRTTRRAGLVIATDLLPTALGWLRIPVPRPVQGRPITVAGKRDAGALRRLERRLRVVYPRRFPALAAAGLALLAVFAALAVARRRRLAMRLVALAFLWIPAVSLLSAALAPSLRNELALMALLPIALALLTDRFLAWPRAPALPALCGVVAYAVDMAAGSRLIVTSLLGPNPRFGSRFYGIGNELEAILPPLLLVGLAGALAGAQRSRRLALTFAFAPAALAVVVGAGRLGADVGGVVTIAAGAAAAVLLALSRISRRAIALAVAAPVAALGALIVLDLATGGDAHLSRTVLGAEDAGAVGDTLARRYELAWDALWRGLMPLATAAALALAAYLIGARRHVDPYPAYRAALGGGLVGALVGALANDSGPVLLVLGVVVVACAFLYIRGRPEQ